MCDVIKVRPQSNCTIRQVHLTRLGEKRMANLSMIAIRMIRLPTSAPNREAETGLSAWQALSGHSRSPENEINLLPHF